MDDNEMMFPQFPNKAAQDYAASVTPAEPQGLGEVPVGVGAASLPLLTWQIVDQLAGYVNTTGAPSPWVGVQLWLNNHGITSSTAQQGLTTAIWLLKKDCAALGSVTPGKALQLYQSNIYNLIQQPSPMTLLANTAHNSLVIGLMNQMGLTYPNTGSNAIGQSAVANDIIALVTMYENLRTGHPLTQAMLTKAMAAYQPSLAPSAQGALSLFFQSSEGIASAFAGGVTQSFAQLAADCTSGSVDPGAALGMYFDFLYATMSGAAPAISGADSTGNNSSWNQIDTAFVQYVGTQAQGSSVAGYAALGALYANNQPLLGAIAEDLLVFTNLYLYAKDPPATPLPIVIPPGSQALTGGNAYIPMSGGIVGGNLPTASTTTSPTDTNLTAVQTALIHPQLLAKYTASQTPAVTPPPATSYTWLWVGLGLAALGGIAYFALRTSPAGAVMEEPTKANPIRRRAPRRRTSKIRRRATKR